MNSFYFSTNKVVKETTSIKCPECGEWSIASSWAQLDIHCDVCEDHSGMKCPKCDRVLDPIWDNEHEWEVRDNENIGEKQ